MLNPGMNLQDNPSRAPKRTNIVPVIPEYLGMPGAFLSWLTINDKLKGRISKVYEY
jgi:hypothetical protein